LLTAWRKTKLCAVTETCGANNSFKPSPLRGLGAGAGAKIVPTPRPLIGPA